MDIKAKVVEGNNISDAWLKTIQFLLANNGESFNLIVQIKNPLKIDSKIDKEYQSLCKRKNTLSVKDVSYTIFPWNFYIGRLCRKNASKLYEKYISRYFPRIMRRSKRWGTYFHDMINWQARKGGDSRNQLSSVIAKIRKSGKRVMKAAYWIQITSPLRQFGQPTGARCLQQIMLQLENRPKRINMLALYRNHDYLQRAYGNFVGLGQLLQFICEKVKYKVGILTCISSHAYIGNIRKRDRNNIIKWSIKPNNATLRTTI